MNNNQETTCLSVFIVVVVAVVIAIVYLTDTRVSEKRLREAQTYSIIKDLQGIVGDLADSQLRHLKQHESVLRRPHASRIPRLSDMATSRTLLPEWVTDWGTSEYNPLRDGVPESTTATLGM